MNADPKSPGPEQNGMLYIVHEYPPIVGGAGIYVSNLANEISADLPLTVLTASETNIARTEEKPHLEILKLSVPFRHRVYHYSTTASLVAFALKSIWKGWRLGRKRKFRGIHAFHVFPAGLVGVILGKLLRIPCYVTAVGAEIHDPAKDTGLYSKWYYRKFIAGILKRGAKLSAISTDIADRASEYYSGKPIEVLPPGIPTPEIPSPRPHNDFVICSVSRLAKRKGIALTIEALAEIKDLPVKYVLIGNGAEKPALQALAKSLGVLDRLDFRGFVDETEKFRILAESDLFVLPSLHEGFGICYVEAMAAGLPVIANSTGGQTDFIIQGENGFLLKALDKKELAGVIRKLHGDEELRRCIGSINRKKAEYYYTPNLKRLYLDHYE